MTSRREKALQRPQYRDRFDRYFQDELTYLRELGAEFAAQDPARSHFDFEAVDDPDVKCLLEGFSFLTARIRQTLDADLPELSHSLLQIMFPQALRPTPPMTVVQFTPKPGALSGVQRIPRGASVGGPRVEGTDVRFRTTMPVDVAPLAIADVALERPGGRGGVLRVRFEAVGGADLGAIGLDRVRLFTRGDAEDADRLLHLLRSAVDRVVVVAGETRRGLDPDGCVRRVGFDLEPAPGEETALMPWPARSFEGYRLLQEYHALPAAFRFVDVELGGSLTPGADPLLGFEVRFELGELRDDMPRVDASNLALFCAPAVNLFEHDADPILVDHQRSDFIIRPEGAGREHFEVHGVESVTLLDQSRAEIPDFYSFAASRAAFPGAPLFYETRLRPSIVAPEGARGATSTDTYLRFVSDDGVPLTALPDGRLALEDVLPPESRVAVRLSCSNRHLAERITPGDLSAGGQGVPPSVSVRGIEPITRTVPPPLGDGTLWKLQSHLTLNAQSLDSADRLRGLLELYDVRFQSDERARQRSRRRVDSVLGLRRRHETALAGGAAVRVVATEIDLDPGGFSGVGEMDAFGLVLAHFLRSYVAMNTASRLTLRVPSTGIELEYPAFDGLEAVH